MKVQTSEMDLAEIRFIDRSSLKSEGAELFRKSGPPLSCESPLKIQRPLVQQMVIRILIANSAHSSVSGLLFTTFVGNVAKNGFESWCEWRD